MTGLRRVNSLARSQSCSIHYCQARRESTCSEKMPPAGAAAAEAADAITASSLFLQAARGVALTPSKDRGRRRRAGKTTFAIIAGVVFQSYMAIRGRGNRAAARSMPKAPAAKGRAGRVVGKNGALFTATSQDGRASHDCTWKRRWMDGLSPSCSQSTWEKLFGKAECNKRRDRRGPVINPLYGDGEHRAQVHKMCFGHVIMTLATGRTGVRAYVLIFAAGLYCTWIFIHIPSNIKCGWGLSCCQDITVYERTYTGLNEPNFFLQLRRRSISPVLFFHTHTYS